LIKFGLGDGALAVVCELGFEILSKRVRPSFEDRKRGRSTKTWD